MLKSTLKITRVFGCLEVKYNEIRSWSRFLHSILSSKVAMIFFFSKFKNDHNICVFWIEGAADFILFVFVSNVDLS